MIHRFVDLFPAGMPVPFVGTSGSNDYIGVLTTDPGQDPTQISASWGSGNVVAPVLSPDETQVAYIIGGSIYVIGVDGSSETKIWDAVVKGGAVDSLDWAKDGSVILFCSKVAGDEHKLFTIEPDGSNETTLYTDGSTRKLAGPYYNPAGTKIGFMVLLSATSIGIWVMDSDGTNAAQVTTTPTQLSLIYANDPFFSWANAGATIAYTGGTLASPTFRVINIDGTGDTLLGSVSAGVSARPIGNRWTPDDTGVLYLADSTTDVRRFESDGSGNSLVRADTVAHNPEFRQYDGRVYFTTNEVSGSDDIVSMLPDGSDYRVETGASSDTYSFV